jgi:hypothetical protein
MQAATRAFAAASASRVLPTPPGPTRVTNGGDASCRILSSRFISSVRPMSGIRATGTLPRPTNDRPIGESTGARVSSAGGAQETVTHNAAPGVNLEPHCV